MTDYSELIELERKATPGPFSIRKYNSGTKIVDADGNILATMEKWTGNRSANANLFAAARNALPDLMADLDRLRAENEALRAVKEAGSALEIAARNRGYGDLPLMDLWINLRDALAALEDPDV